MLILAESWVLLCMVMVCLICMLTSMMFLCRYGRDTGEMERERPGYITGGDPGRSGCPSCVGQVWGSKVFGEPFDESWRALVGPDYQLLGSRA